MAPAERTKSIAFYCTNWITRNVLTESSDVQLSRDLADNAPVPHQLHGVGLLIPAPPASVPIYIYPPQLRVYLHQFTGQYSCSPALHCQWESDLVRSVQSPARLILGSQSVPAPNTCAGQHPRSLGMPRACYIPFNYIDRIKSNEKTTRPN